MSSIRNVFEDEEYFFQQDGSPPHYHCDVQPYLNEILPSRWNERRVFVEYLPRSPDLTPLDFFLWGYLKDKVYATKTATIAELRDAIEQECTQIPNEVFLAVINSITFRSQQCLDKNGYQFENGR